MIQALVLFVLLGTLSVSAQTNVVRSRLQKVAVGNVDEVRRELPDLLAEYPSDPGVTLLHAVLVEDASKALVLYEKIVREYASSEWADDAQWRIVQFYAIRRDTARARQELQNYRKAYPQSEFLLNAVETVKASVGLGRPGLSDPRLVQSSKKKDSSQIASRTAEGVPSVQSNADKTQSSMTAQSDPSKPGNPKATPVPSDGKADQSRTAVSPKSGELSATKSASGAEASAKTDPSKSQPGKATTIGGTTPAGSESESKTAKTLPSKQLDETKSDSKAVYSLQVGLYNTREKAEEEVGAFKQNKRVRALVVEKDSDSGKKFAVYIGEYATKELAEKQRQTVQEICKCTPFVVKR